MEADLWACDRGGLLEDRRCRCDYCLWRRYSILSRSRVIEPIRMRRSGRFIVRGICGAKVGLRVFRRFGYELPSENP